MGLDPYWREDFVETLQEMNISAELFQEEPFYLIRCNSRLSVHLIPLGTLLTPIELVQLQSFYGEKDIQILQLWEDVWMSRREQVLNRISSFLGLNETVHGRKTDAISINSELTSCFLNQYHLQGYARAKFNYGLFLDNDLVAVASFSRVRLMKSKGQNYKSAELVRFASKTGLTVVGGLSKLIKHFLSKVEVNDLMTYADRDWSLGTGYEKLGFKLTDITPPTSIYVDMDSMKRYFPHRLPTEALAKFKIQTDLDLKSFFERNGYAEIFNTGNLKYHFFIK